MQRLHVSPGPRFRSPCLHRLLVWLLLPVYVLQTGCAPVDIRPPEHDLPLRLGRVAVIPVDVQPEIAFEGFAHGKGEGAAHGAGGAIASCLGGMGSGGCSGEFCGAVLIIVLGICSVAGVVGGVAGAAKAPAARQARESEQELQNLVTAGDIHESLARQVVLAARGNGTPLVEVPPALLEQVRATRDYGALADAGVDTVLEVALASAGTTGSGINPPLRLAMSTRIRLLSVADGSELFSARYTHAGARLKLAEWQADSGVPLVQGLYNGYVALGALIHDNIFLLYPFPDRRFHVVGLLTDAFGLAAVEPATRGVLTGDRLLGSVFEWKAVNGRQPTLQWQGFPRPGDLEQDPRLAARIGRVRYDLVVAREENMVPGEIVYRRAGISGTRHRLQQPLQADTRYFWNVRARFELDGRERVTEWASLSRATPGTETVPSAHSYRFRTH